MLVCAANYFACKYLLRGMKRWESLGPIVTRRLVTVYGARAGRLWITLSIVLILCSAIFISLEPLKNNCLDSDLKRQ